MATSRRDDSIAPGFGLRVQEARQRLWMSQAALGEAIGGDTATIYRTEAGDNLPQLATFAALCIALDVSADFLLFGDSGRPRVLKR